MRNHEKITLLLHRLNGFEVLAVLQRENINESDLISVLILYNSSEGNDMILRLIQSIAR